jgi:hypothetical protein
MPRRYTEQDIKNMKLGSQTALALNPETPPEILAMIAKNGINDIPLKSYLGGNPNTPPETLHDLVLQERNDTIYRVVATNKNTSPKTLEFLSKIPKRYIMHRVARNPNTPLSVLTDFVTDSLNHAAVLENENITESILVKICDIQRKNKKNFFVLRRIKKHPKCPKWLRHLINTIIEMSLKRT